MLHDSFTESLSSLLSVEVNAMVCVAKLQFKLTRVIIVTLAGTDGEMFVSSDYNYNHSVIPKRSGGAAFD